MSLDLADLARRGERIGEARNATKADVWRIDDGGRALVVKTIAGRAPRPARALAAALLRREGRVLAKLAGVPGVPRLVETTPDALVVEWVPGETLFQLRKRGVSPETERRLREIVAALHARGFAHGDIGRRDVLVAADGRVALVDFATAVGPGFPPLLWRLLLPVWKRRDRSRIRKMLRRYRRRWDQRMAKNGATPPTS